VKWSRVVELARELPEVNEGIWFRTPALMVGKKSFVRLKEDGASVVFLVESVDEQELLIAARPDIYFITDHYVGWPAVLARLSTLTAAECRARLEQAWRKKAPRTLVKQRDARHAEPRSRRTRRVRR
jgi:hypothetical protein